MSKIWIAYDINGTWSHFAKYGRNVNYVNFINSKLIVLNLFGETNLYAKFGDLILTFNLGVR